MNSFVQANQQTIIDFNAINPKLRQQSKTYSFFIYFLRRLIANNSTYLQKLGFKLRQEKAWGWDKQQNGRPIQLFFVDLQNESQVDQSFFDLKMQLAQNSKIKLIFYSQQQHLLFIQTRAYQLSIDLSQVPIGLYSSNLLGDLSQHLGWLDAQLGNLSQKSSRQFQSNVKKWISSPSQKIDLWEVLISVDQKEGNIFKVDPKTNLFSPLKVKKLKENFLSHLSVGHHSQLAASYESNYKQKNSSVINNCIFSFQRFKKFCCLGSPSLLASTGVVSINFQDQKGRPQQITKQLMLTQSKKGVMTLLFSNIDRFQGTKLKAGRMNDGMIQMGVFQSRDQYRLICSAGQINLNLKAQQVYIQVNSSCLKLSHPTEIKIRLERKMKVLINKETLQC